MPQKPDKQTLVLAIEAGCTDCHGPGVVHWKAANAMAVAARHSRRHGHRTWAHQSIEVRYGRAEPKSPHLPGMEPGPIAELPPRDLVPGAGTSTVGA